MAVDELLAREYGWLPYESDDLYWADISRYLMIINDRQENKAKEKIGEYIVLLNIIHAEKPGRLLDSFKAMLEPDKCIDDDLGDMHKFKAFKEKVRTGNRGSVIWQRIIL